MAIQGFWGLQLEPNKQYSQKVAVPFMITMASLTDTVVAKSRSSLTVTVDNVKYSLCNLTPHTRDQQLMNLTFLEGEQVTFAARGSNAIHLTGNYVFDDKDCNDQQHNTEDKQLAVYKGDNSTTYMDEMIDAENYVNYDDGFDLDEFNDFAGEELNYMQKAHLKRLADDNTNGPSKRQKDLQPTYAPNNKHSEQKKLVHQPSSAIKSQISKPVTARTASLSKQKQLEYRPATPSAQKRPVKVSKTSSRANFLDEEPIIEIPLDAGIDDNNTDDGYKDSGDDDDDFDDDDNVNDDANDNDYYDDSDYLDNEIFSRVKEYQQKRNGFGIVNNREMTEYVPMAGDATQKHSISTTPPRMNSNSTSSVPRKNTSPESPIPRKSTNPMPSLPSRSNKTPTLPPKNNNNYRGTSLSTSSRSSAHPSTTSSTPRLPNGMVVEDKNIGTGHGAKSGDKIGIRYLAKLPNGTVFARHITDPPFEFVMKKGSIKHGWNIAVLGMKVGGERRLKVPSNLAYTASDLPPGVRMNTTLIFDIKLITLESS